MPLALPALIVTRSPGAWMRRMNESWPPVRRNGVAGSSWGARGGHAGERTSGGRLAEVAGGPHASDRISGGRFVDVAGGPSWANSGDAAAINAAVARTLVERELDVICLSQGGGPCVRQPIASSTLRGASSHSRRARSSGTPRAGD